MSRAMPEIEIPPVLRGIFILLFYRHFDSVFGMPVKEYLFAVDKISFGAGGLHPVKGNKFILLYGGDLKGFLKLLGLLLVKDTRLTGNEKGGRAH